MKRAARSATVGSSETGGTGSRPRRMRSIMPAAFSRASSASMSSYRPTVARLGSPPGVRAWATNSLRPVACTRIPNPGSSLSQNTADARSTLRRSMVRLLSFTAPMGGNSPLVGGLGRSSHGPGSSPYTGGRKHVRGSGRPTNIRSANRSSFRNRPKSFRCPRRLSPVPSWGLYPTCGENTISIITVCYHPIEHIRSNMRPVVPRAENCYIVLS